MERKLDDIIDTYETASAFGNHDALGISPRDDVAAFGTVTTGSAGRGDRPSYWEDLWSAA
jgi:hypothetical protein